MRRCSGSRLRSSPVVGQAVEGVELDLVVVLARVQGVEVGDAVDAKHHGLAVDDEPGLSDLPGGLDDPGIPAGLLPMGSSTDLDTAKVEFTAAWKALKAGTTPAQLAAAYRAMNRDGG